MARQGRKSFLFSLDAFFALALFGFAVIAVSLRDPLAFKEKLLILSGADLIEDIMSSLEESGKIAEIAEPDGLSYYGAVLSKAESEAGRNLCLFLDREPIYRFSCRGASLCAERHFAKANSLGIVEFRKASLCFENAERRPS